MAYGFENNPDLARFQKLRNRKTREGGTIVRYPPCDRLSFIILLKLALFDINQYVVNAFCRRNLSSPSSSTIRGSNGSTPLVLIGLEKWLVSTRDILLLIS